MFFSLSHMWEREQEAALSRLPAATSQAVLDATRDVVKQRIALYAAEYIRALPI